MSTAAPQPLYELRPLGPGEILDYSRRLFQRVFPLTVVPLAILQGPFLVLLYYATNVLQGALQFETPEDVQDYVDHFQELTYWVERVYTKWGIDLSYVLEWQTGDWIRTTAIFVLYCWVYAGVSALTNVGAIAVAGERWLGLVPTAASVWNAWRRFGLRAIGITFIQGLVMTASIGLPVLILPLAAVLGGGPALMVVAMLLMIFAVTVATVFVMWFSVATYLAECTLVVENLGVIAAMRRAMALARGNWWRIFGNVMLLQIVTNIVVSLIVGVGSLILSAALPRYELATMTLLQLTTTIFITPLILVQAVLIYFDLRVRGEAFDLYYLSGGVPDAAAESAPTLPSGAPTLNP